jgi:tetratricopeptide (TPR) repeat protein
MDLIFLILTILSIIITIIFGYLQVVVPLIKGEVRFSKRFPFLETAKVPVLKRRRLRRKKRKRFLIPALAIGLLVILFALIRFLVFQAKAIERIPIAVINFTNHTGDEQFDYLCAAIPNLLITNLEQSKHLSVLTWERMHDLLKIMGKEDVPIVDEDLGFEICKMDDIETVITGSFTKAGNMFVTEVKVLDVPSKKILKTSSSQGEGVASILRIQIDELSRDIARSVSLYERMAVPTEMRIRDVTTSSMEAYNYFLRGREEYEKWYFHEARKFLERAIEIDSTFASAYLFLSFVYDLPFEERLSIEALEKARKFSHMATDREQLFIEAMYELLIERNSEKELHIYRQWATKYPKDKWAHLWLGWNYQDRQIFDRAIEEYNKAVELDPSFGRAWNNLGGLYAQMGVYDKAIECFKRYAAVFPGDANPFDSMGDLYLRMGVLDEALAQYREAMFVKPDFMSSRKIAYIYALREDYAEAMKWVDHYITFAPSSAVKANGYRLKSWYNNLLGNFDRAVNALDTVKGMLEPTNWSEGWLYYDMRKYELSRNCFKDSYDTLFSGWDSVMAIIDYNSPLGLVDVKQENLDSARARLATINFLLPKAKTTWNRYLAQLYHDILYAEVLLAQDSLEKVIVIAEAISQKQIDNLGNSLQQFIMTHIIMIHIKDIAARAYIKKGDIDRAILEYERLIDPDPNKRGRCLVRPTWRYELAKLYEQKGLKVKAIGQYKKFLDIWKDADADRPELIDAKNRLAKLKAVS